MTDPAVHADQKRFPIIRRPFGLSFTNGWEVRKREKRGFAVKTLQVLALDDGLPISCEHTGIIKRRNATACRQKWECRMTGTGLSYSSEPVSRELARRASTSRLAPLRLLALVQARTLAEARLWHPSARSEVRSCTPITLTRESLIEPRGPDLLPAFNDQSRPNPTSPAGFAAPPAKGQTMNPQRRARAQASAAFQRAFAQPCHDPHRPEPRSED